MKLHRVIVSLSLLAFLAGVAYVAQQIESAGVKMTTAAEKFLTGLSAEQKAKAVFAFDDKERSNWYFVPLQNKDRKSTRKGLPLEEMSVEQKQAALDLVRAGTSMSGYEKATTIMSLEAILNDFEKGKAMVRNPGWYFFAIFGKPGKDEKWGWRVEGHHLSLNFTMEGGKVISSTPAFFGANPATIKQGPKQGQRTLPEAEDHARELFDSLDDDQKKTASREKHYPEIEQAKTKHNLAEPEGLPASKMTEKQRDILWKLIESYSRRMPDDVAEVELKQVKDAGLEKISFACTGSMVPGKPSTYRVHGPTFVIEFLNLQPDSAGNVANHIHSVWRDAKGDFGLAEN